MSRADRYGRRTGHPSGRLRKGVLALTVGVLAPSGAHAAPAPTEPVSLAAPGRSVTLAEALAFARSHQPSLQSARARAAAAAAAADTASRARSGCLISG